MSTKEKPIWKILYQFVIDFVKSETNSTSSKINLIFGILVFTVIIGSMTTELVDKIIKLFNSKVDFGLPWYAVVSMFALGIVYFIYCVNEVAKIDKLKNKLEYIRSEKKASAN